MRVLTFGIVVLCACSGGSNTQATAPVAPTPTPPPTPPTGAVPVPVDAAVAAALPATEIRPLALAGPFPTLGASCLAARPCGARNLDLKGNEIDAPTKPDCTAVLDQSRDRIGHLPSSIHKPNAPPPKLAHAIAGGEIRIGAVTCAVPQGIRREHSQHYVFVKRADGWWRTDLPVFSYDYQNRYCDGSIYLLWNTKPTSTIAGIAAAHTCLNCNKQGSREDLLELMLRVETGGAKPIVFAPLPVGTRHKTTIDSGDGQPGQSDPDCKPSSSAVSMKETWVSDDEVVLDGPATATGKPFDHELKMGDMRSYVPAAPGRYRFTR